MQLHLYTQREGWRAKFEEERPKARKHILLLFFELPRDRGYYFLMEHPAYADSWKIEELVELSNLGGVMTEIADQCMYGLTTPNEDRTGESPAKKPTKFLSNPCASYNNCQFVALSPMCINS